MNFLRSISLKKHYKKTDTFPFNLPVIQSLSQLKFTQNVTFFIGENGTGKSTLLEAIAAGINSIVVGGEPIESDVTLKYSRELSRALKFIWSQKTHKGFFLRAEDFFRFCKKINTMTQEMDDTIDDFDNRFSGYGLMLAKGAIQNQKNQLTQKYGEDINAFSHGESFLQLFQSRFVPDGLYLLDEPETPLSPLRELSFLSLLKQMTSEHNSQFIIATHSPIMMAFPNAQIISFDNDVLEEIDYESIEHVNITRDFLNNPDQFLRHL